VTDAGQLSRRGVELEIFISLNFVDGGLSPFSFPCVHCSAEFSYTLRRFYLFFASLCYVYLVVPFVPFIPSQPRASTTCPRSLLCATTIIGRAMEHTYIHIFLFLLPFLSSYLLIFVSYIRIIQLLFILGP
jgi:hypothetical protein